MRALALALAAAALLSCSKRAAAPPACGGGRCLAVPTGIIGLGFGMSPAQVKAAIGETRTMPPDSVSENLGHGARHLLGVPYALASTVRRRAKRSLPGTRMRGDSHLANQDARCVFDFAVQGRLSRIECEIRMRARPFSQLAPKLRESLYAKYGPPREVSDHTEPGGLPSRTAWRNREAMLIMTIDASPPSSSGGSSLTLVNVSAEHQAVVEELRARADAAMLGGLVIFSKSGVPPSSVAAARDAFERDMLGAPERPGLEEQPPAEAPPPPAPPAPESQAAAPVAATPPAGQGDAGQGAWREGPADAPVTIVVGTDFACSYCRRAHETLTQLLARYPGKIQLVHTVWLIYGDKSRAAAEGMCAAARQGKLHQMNEALWPLQPRFHDGSAGAAEVAEIAASLGLDADRFAADARGPCRQAVDQQSARWRADKRLSGVPFFIVNGTEVIKGAQNVEVLSRAVDQAMATTPEAAPE